MEGSHLLPDLIQQRDKVLKNFRKDVYLLVPIHESISSMFAWEGKHYKIHWRDQIMLECGFQSNSGGFLRIQSHVIYKLRT